jgi:general secretion pathway protein G
MGRVWFSRWRKGRTGAPPTARAFTLTEMLVVLVIIGLIAAIVGPRLFSRLDDAKRRTAHLQITNLAAAVDLFRVDSGRLPTRDEGLDVLLHTPSDQVEWLGPYLAKDHIPDDPWGHPYVYQLDDTGMRFSIISYGSDGKPGGSGSAKDISSDDDNGRRRALNGQAGASSGPAASDGPAAIGVDPGSSSPSATSL